MWETEEQNCCCGRWLKHWSHFLTCKRVPHIFVFKDSSTRWCQTLSLRVLNNIVVTKFPVKEEVKLAKILYMLSAGYAERIIIMCQSV